MCQRQYTVDYQSLAVVSESCLYVINTSSALCCPVICDKGRIEVTGASVHTSGVSVSVFNVGIGIRYFSIVLQFLV